MKKTLLLLIVTSLYFTSCKKSDVSINRPDDINVTIEGIVSDIDGNVPVSGVTVSTTIDGRIITTKTDTNGVYVIKNLNSGSYNVVFNSTGYGTMSKVVDANPINFSGNHYVANFNLKMFKFNQNLTTRVVIQKGQEYIPASNVPVNIYLSNDFVNNKIVDTTDAAGNISVANLPNTNVRLEVDYKSGDYHYYIGDYGSVTNLPFNFDNRYILSQENVTLFYLMSSNIIVSSTGNITNAFVNTGSITFQFSNPADLNYPDMVINLSKQVSEGNYVPVAKVVTWSNSNTKLTIDPIGTSLDTGAFYQVELSLKSLSNINYPETGSAKFTFMVKNKQFVLSQVNNVSLISPLPVIANTDTAIIQFDRVPNADYYSIYGNYGKADEYLILASYTPIDYSASNYQVTVFLSTLPGINVPVDGLFNNGANYKLIVRAGRNDGPVGGLSVPLILHQ